MERLYLTGKELKQLPLYHTENTNEADILDYSDTEIIKYFYLPSKNKVYTLSEIEQQEQDLKLVKELLIFKKIVLEKSHIKGILLDKGYESNLRDFIVESDYSFNDLIIIFQNIGRVLENLEHIRNEEGKLKSFFIGDLHETNVLVDPISKKIQICDIDSCKIGNNKPFLTAYLNFYFTYDYVLQNLSTKYLYNYSCVQNQNTDLYCYNVMILKNLFNIDIEFLSVKSFYKQLYSLKENGLPEPLFQIFLNLYNTVDNQNPYKLLDTIPNYFEKQRIL